ncbi:hypothetical protein, partial [Xanthomonas campestris]|uniref:hypothetical protein n=1 Tax=Xanthomonas campestris TaxID=339 RepID=UPI0039C0CA2D
MDALIGFGLPAAERVGARIIRWRRRTKWVSSDATIKTHSYAAALRCSAHGHAAEHVVLMVLACRGSTPISRTVVKELQPSDP